MAWNEPGGGNQHDPWSGGGRRGGNGNGNGNNHGGNNNHGGKNGNGNGKNGNGKGRGRNNRGRRNVPKSMQGADLTKRLPEPPKQPKDALRIYALGGISEIGRNMTVFEYGDDLIIIDCGVLFPSSGEPGVDLILPDFGPIEKKIHKVKALVVTHAHEDHIGAIPWLLKLRPDIPIVASRFTIALIAAKCKEHRQKPKFVEVNEKSDVTYGCFRVRFWAVNHSVPDALGIMLGTPAGNIIHTGDIKLDQTPLDNRPTDLPALSRYGDEGVDPMLGIHWLQEAYFNRIPDYPKGITVPAIALANDSKYGLTGTVFGADIEEATRVASALDVGGVGINLAVQDAVEPAAHGELERLEGGVEPGVVEVTVPKRGRCVSGRRRRGRPGHWRAELPVGPWAGAGFASWAGCCCGAACCGGCGICCCACCG